MGQDQISLLLEARHLRPPHFDRLSAPPRPSHYAALRGRRTTPLRSGYHPLRMLRGPCGPPSTSRTGAKYLIETGEGTPSALRAHPPFWPRQNRGTQDQRERKWGRKKTIKGYGSKERSLSPLKTPTPPKAWGFPTKNVGLPQRTRFVSIYYPSRYNLLTLLTAKGSGFTKIIN